MDETQIKQIIERQPLHGTALLDPRCKILLLVCIGFVSYFLAGEVVSLALMLVYGLFIALGNGGKWAAKMIITYIVVAYLNALLRYVQVPVLSVIMSVFGVTVLKLIPIVMMGLWILRTTYMDDLMVALQRMRLPQAVTIPLVVMFRYIPTLRIEYRQIRSTMDIRGISDTVWKRVCHPLATIEYILIPLLMRCLKVTDELSPRQRLIFTLRDIEELDVPEVQTITGLSAGIIKTTLYLARKNIRNKMNQIDAGL